MKKLYSLILMAVFCAGSILADEWATKVITIKHGNLTQIFRTITNLLAGSGVLASTDGEHLILRGNKDTVAGFEEVIKQLDVPPVVKKNIESTVYMIVASAQAGSTPMPAELDPVLKQLKSVFPYKGYRVLDSFVIRSRDGEQGDTSGFVPPLPGTNVPAGNKMIYTVRYHRVTADGPDGGRVVRFDQLKLGMKVPTSVDAKGSVSYADLGISTDVDVPEGKKVVVGKTSAVEGSDGALILVISAKVVD